GLSGVVGGNRERVKQRTRALGLKHDLQLYYSGRLQRHRNARRTFQAKVCSIEETHRGNPQHSRSGIGERNSDKSATAFYRSGIEEYLRYRNTDVPRCEDSADICRDHYYRYRGGRILTGAVSCGEGYNKGS